jgi:sugar lactone lactonase YvrE
LTSRVIDKTITGTICESGDEAGGECVLKIDNYLGETPIWSSQDGALWWINCECPPEILRWIPNRGEVARWPMPQRVGGIALTSLNTLLVALGDGLYDFDPRSAELKIRAASPFVEHVNLHECRCDRQGRFWVGGFDQKFPSNPSSAAAGYCRFDSTKLTPLVKDIQCANGLAFSPNGRILYLASSPGRFVFQYDLNPDSGDISNRRVFVTLEEGFGYIDGATVDNSGGYWLAVVGAAAVRRYLPDGSLDRQIRLPFSNPTGLAFGGEDLRTLFVTSTKMQINPEVRGGEENGALFALRPGEQGVAESRFPIETPGTKATM